MNLKNSAGWTSSGYLTLGYAFLYLPIIALVVYSFNASKLVSVWSGFSLHWYRQLLQDDEIISATLLSIKIALMTASGAVVLGTLAAYTLVRYQRFRGRYLFTGLVTAPLVMPEIVIGLSLLLFLVALQKTLAWPERGMLTICLGHTLVAMAYATVMIRARLQEMNRTLEEAAMDLGCTPGKVFILITLPLISQTLLSTWLLTFTLSFDDVLISAFLSGPGSTTLPLIIFARARLGLSPEVNAVATVMIGCVTLGVVAASAYLARQQQGRLREINQRA